MGKLTSDICIKFWIANGKWKGKTFTKEYLDYHFSGLDPNDPKNWTRFVKKKIRNRIEEDRHDESDTGVCLWGIRDDYPTLPLQYVVRVFHLKESDYQWAYVFSDIDDRQIIHIAERTD
jgi:hypothetical protein